MPSSKFWLLPTTKKSPNLPMRMYLVGSLFNQITLTDMNTQIVQDKLQQKVFNYIVENIGFNGDESGMSVREKFEYLLNAFDEEYNNAYYKRTYHVLVTRLENWLQGLPSSFNIDFMNDSIIHIGREWGILKRKRDEGDWVYRWFNFIAMWILIFSHRLGIDTQPYC